MITIFKGNWDVFFTADQHFGHKNIIKYCQRPFADVTEMDNELIARWNSRVHADDLVFHLGDVTLGDDAAKYFSRLNGRIYLLRLDWHHDYRWLRKQGNSSLVSASGHPLRFLPPLDVIEVEYIRRGEHPLTITLSHYPMAEWEASHYGAWHIHGHSHGAYYDLQGRFVIDAGVDATGFAPLSFAEVLQHMCGLGFKLDGTDAVLTGSNKKA